MPDETTEPDLDAPAIFAILDHHEVEYVLVGGYAAQLHGARRPTTDVNLTPERSAGNLGRLAASLAELGAASGSKGSPRGSRSTPLPRRSPPCRR